jgi:hypothetical protein
MPNERTRRAPPMRLDHRRHAHRRAVLSNGRQNIAA